MAGITAPLADLRDNLERPGLQAPDMDILPFFIRYTVCNASVLQRTQGYLIQLGQQLV